MSCIKQRSDDYRLFEMCNRDFELRNSWSNPCGVEVRLVNARAFVPMMTIDMGVISKDPKALKALCSHMIDIERQKEWIHRDYEENYVGW